MIVKFKYETLLSIAELNKLLHDLETYDKMIIESVNREKNIVTVKLNDPYSINYLYELQLLHDIKFWLNMDEEN
jgi:hypothetical protein